MPHSPAHRVEFQRLYAEHHRWVMGWLLRRLHCHADAADLTQDTFLRTLTSPQLERIEEPRTFLCVIAKRVLYTFWRRNELERAYLEALAGLPQPLTPSEEEFALLRETVMAVDRLLDGLPGKVRQAFLLNRLEGLSHPQIALEMNVSLATVERWIRRALTHCYLARVEAPHA